MLLTLTPAKIALLREKRIFFETKAEQLRLNETNKLNMRKDAKAEPYIGIYSGLTLPRFIGAFSYVWSPLHVDLSIGRYCSISRQIDFDFTNHPHDFVSTSTFMYSQEQAIVRQCLADEGVTGYNNFRPAKQKPPAVIGNDVWVGAYARIMPGVAIGDGAVIATGAIVTKNVAPYTIVGGTPATPIKQRFSDELISDLLASEWWQYKFTDFGAAPLEKPRDFLSYLRDNDLKPYKPAIFSFESII